jgi:hypothetical protein
MSLPLAQRRQQHRFGSEQVARKAKVGVWCVVLCPERGGGGL